MKKKERNNVAIYCRLSKDDGDSLESQSISNQKEILTKYCLANNLNIYDIYIDDGYTGTNFNRPGFIKMINDIESGLIDIVITKDLSRLGRDHIELGRYVEQYFPKMDVRYIAVSDTLDTKTGVDDKFHLLSLVNELYSKDMSRKIRTSNKMLMEKGVYRRSKFPLYGYLDNIEKNRREINPETAPNVVMIYDLYIKGYSIEGIIQFLEDHNIFTPQNYLLYKDKKEIVGNPYKWDKSNIRRILTNREYLGDYIRGKTKTIFKVKGFKKVPIDEQYVFEGMFDPIIKKEVFDMAQELFNRNRKNSALTNPYHGIAYCAICGSPLRIQRHKGGSGVYEERLVCANTNEIGKGTILLKDLNEVLLNEFRILQNVILNNKDEFYKYALDRLNTLSINIENSENEIKLRDINRKIKEIDNYIRNLFEEKTNNIIKEATYEKLMNEYKFKLNTYEIEKRKIEILLDNKESNIDNKTKLESFINSLTDLDDNNFLSYPILRNIISKIMISTYSKDVNKHILGKNITIYYRHVDKLIKEFIETKGEK